MEVEKLKAVLHNVFWCVRESSNSADTMTAVGVLTWLLQVKDSCYAFFLELLVNLEFFNKRVRKPLRRYNVRSDPVWIKAYYRWVLN